MANFSKGVALFLVKPTEVYTHNQYNYATACAILLSHDSFITHENRYRVTDISDPIFSAKICDMRLMEVFFLCAFVAENDSNRRNREEKKKRA